MTEFVDIAKELGIEDELFLMFLEKKLDADGIKEWYTTTDVYVVLLDRHRRTYQAWEKEFGFPVPEPQRRGRGGGRVYSPEQVVKVLWWWWNHRAIERRGRGGEVDGIGED